METPPPLGPQRHQPARNPAIEAHNGSTIIFLTVCTHNRKPLLACGDAVDLLINSWRRADAWLVGRWTVLPDHLHLFCSPSSPDAPPLTRWVKFWKSHASRHWPCPHEQPIWQQNFWDRQLRAGEHYSAKWDYVRHNPVRHHLVATADAWPWQGELNVFRFHDA